jgi:hypothetical protein
MNVYIDTAASDMIEVMTLLLDAAGHRVASSVAGATAIRKSWNSNRIFF